MQERATAGSARLSLDSLLRGWERESVEDLAQKSGDGSNVGMHAANKVYGIQHVHCVGLHVGHYPYTGSSVQGRPSPLRQWCISSSVSDSPSHFRNIFQTSWTLAETKSWRRVWEGRKENFRLPNYRMTFFRRKFSFHRSKFLTTLV